MPRKEHFEDANTYMLVDVACAPEKHCSQGVWLRLSRVMVATWGLSSPVGRVKAQILGWGPTETDEICQEWSSYIQRQME